MKNRKLPIGYYLKKADNLLTEGINKIHAEFSITRTGWQILNSIYEKPNIEKQAMIEVLKQFASVESLENTIGTLKARNLINGDNNYSLTESGQELYSGCLHRQTDFRKKAMAGISEQEYLCVISTLEKLINNISAESPGILA
jgi:DNA-binding MarR family transcriptional regulator